jgi:hypothetical protein
MIRATTTYKDLGVVFLQLGRGFTDGTEDALEGVGNIGEIGNSTTNNKNLKKE